MKIKSILSAIHVAFLGVAAISFHAIAVSPCQFPLAGDLNRDCKVDMIDLAWFASSWLDDVSGEPEAFLPDGIYVAAPEWGGFDTAGCGSMTAPCATIGYGIIRAGNNGRQYVFVADGVYYETVSVANGINLLGGFDPLTWVRRDPALSGSTIAGVASAAHSKTIVAAFVTNPTEVSGFHIKGAESSQAEKNSYAVWIANSDSDFVLKDNYIYAAGGTDGIDGADGKEGIDGPDGAGGIGASNSMGSVVSNEWKGAAGTSGQDAATGGKGGTAGGGAFGVFIVNTTAGSNKPSVFNNVIYAGRGGNGGDGGFGGIGQQQGAGGGGGGGAGGIACGIYLWNVTGSPDFHLTNLFAGTNAGGSGGKGGKSFGNAGTPGVTGAALNYNY